MTLSPTEYRLLNGAQRDFPLDPRPFIPIGTRLGIREAEVLALIGRLRAQGAISRLGAVIAPNTLGASTLAAMAVPEARIEEVAARVSARSEVNHNYAREHAINLWFVVTAADRAAVAAVLGELEAETGLKVLDLPLVRAYHVDLGFDLEGGPCAHRSCAPRVPIPKAACMDSFDRRLLLAIEDGLPLTPRPYAQVALGCGLSEADVISRLRRLIARGVIRRFGLVVRHHELGYRANAMAVWDVSDQDVDAVGRRLAAEDAVTLCYRRPRRLPRWPYNLFCMIHGRDRDTVLAQIGRLNAGHGLEARPQALLFSQRRFKQCGARYGAGAEAARGAA
jgi:DNA-binding Lrp family transcriptional regulator